MRPAFRLASFLLGAFFLLVFFGVASLGVLGHAPGKFGTASAAGACVSSETIDASDPYSWSAYSYANLCQDVNFTVTNIGTYQHTFTVSNIANTTATNPGFFAPGSVYYNEPLGAGATLYADIHFNYSIASYEFTCIPHFGEGMHGTFWVGEAAQSGSSSHGNSFEPFWYIVGVVGTLAVLSVVGGLVYGKAGAESTALEPGGPVTSHAEYYNDSRPEPLDSAEPMKRGSGHP